MAVREVPARRRRPEVLEERNNWRERPLPLVVEALYDVR
jgi:hypothetical protein